MNKKRKEKVIMRNDGKYAEIINELAEHIYNNKILKTQRRAKIKFPDGNIREIDLLVILKNQEQIVFEVRDRKGNQGVDWIDQVIGKYKDTSFSKIWICTFGKCSLSKDAIRALTYNNIGWRNIDVGESELNFNNNKEPVLKLHAVKIYNEECIMKVNNEVYREVELKGINSNKEDVSIYLKENLLDDIRNDIKINFDNYLNINNVVYKTRIEMSGIENNFNKNSIDVEINLPISHYIIYDYFNEEYYINNNSENDTLLSTNNKSIFISNDNIILNFSYLSNLEKEGYIVADHYVLNIQAIPQKFRDKNKIKIIDVDGNSNRVIKKVVGYK